MVRNSDALARRQERAELRQDQILDAAETCFIEEGFHGASMSRIASAARMSVGHIYQYFESKEAIIIALCERRFADFEKLLSAPDENASSDTSPIDTWLYRFAWWIDPVRAPLTLEIMSEAGRNPKVANVVERIDHRFREMMRDNFLPLIGPLPREEVTPFIEAVIMLSHGMTSRITADSTADPAQIMAAFRLAVHRLLQDGRRDH